MFFVSIFCLRPDRTVGNNLFFVDTKKTSGSDSPMSAGYMQQIKKFKCDFV